MKPDFSSYSVKKDTCTLVYSRRVGKMTVEHVFPVGNDPAAEEVIYGQFKRQIAELVVKAVSKEQASN